MKCLHNQNNVGIFAGYFGKCEMEPELTLCLYCHSLFANFSTFKFATWFINIQFWKRCYINQDIRFNYLKKLYYLFHIFAIKIYLCTILFLRTIKQVFRVIKKTKQKQKTTNTCTYIVMSWLFFKYKLVLLIN